MHHISKVNFESRVNIVKKHVKKMIHCSHEFQTKLDVEIHVRNQKNGMLQNSTSMIEKTFKLKSRHETEFNKTSIWSHVDTLEKLHWWMICLRVLLCPLGQKCKLLGGNIHWPNPLNKKHIFTKNNFSFSSRNDQWLPWNLHQMTCTTQ